MTCNSGSFYTKKEIAHPAKGSFSVRIVGGSPSIILSVILYEETLRFLFLTSNRWKGCHLNLASFADKNYHVGAPQYGIFCPYSRGNDPQLKLGSFSETFSHWGDATKPRILSV